MVTLIVILILIRSLLFQSFFIPSASMEPALLPGDYVIVTKADYGYSKYSFPVPLPFLSGRFPPGVPKRGDVVVFCLSRDPRVDFVKRVIGLPGDVVQVVGGRLEVNDAPVGIRDLGGETFWEDGAQIPAEAYEETLPNGRTDRILKQTSDGFFNNTPPYSVPSGMLFMLGDNRDDSLDSRMDNVGYVPIENVVGRVAVIFFSKPEGGGVQWFRILRPVW